MKKQSALNIATINRLADIIAYVRDTEPEHTNEIIEAIRAENFDSEYFRKWYRNERKIAKEVNDTSLIDLVVAAMRCKLNREYQRTRR